MTKEEFVKLITDDFINVPKFVLHLADLIEHDPTCEGSHTVDLDSGVHNIILLENIFSNFPVLMSVLIHECVHTGMSDMLRTLEDSEQLNPTTCDRITERAAYLASETLRSILLRYTKIANAWEEMYGEGPQRWKSKIDVPEE